MLKKSILILTSLFLIVISNAQEIKMEIPEPYPLEDYNFVFGTQAIGCKYKFTKAPYLIEQARQIRSMGSNILKISLTRQYLKTYNIQKDKNIKTTLALIKKKKQFQRVMNIKFKYIFAQVHTLTEVKWGKGMTPDEKLVLYKEIYELTEYFLKEYNNTGKTFFIGNWEADRLLLGKKDMNAKPNDEKIQHMIEWFNVRQAAVDAAKKSIPHTNVNVFHYVEVNLVNKGIKGKKCVTTSILPQINVDLISYATSEILKHNHSAKKIKSNLKRNIDFIESQLKPKEGIPYDRRVFIGKYGFDIQKNTEQQQSDKSKQIMLAALEMNLPFALQWQMYNSQYVRGETKGMSMISEAGLKKPIYHLHAKYYKKMNKWLKNYHKENNIYPDRSEFLEKAKAILESL